MESMRYGVNAPDVMHETIDGEVIAINLVSGNYYSLRGTGAEVWALVSDSGPIRASEIADVLAPRYSSPHAEIDTEVARLLGELAEEGLVAGSAAENGPTRAPVPLSVVESPGAFVPPSLERYTDMQDLVLLDPVHQVDDTGWPRTAEEAGATDPLRRTA